MSKGKRLRTQRRATLPPVGKRRPPDRRLWIAIGLVLATAIPSRYAFGPGE